MLDRIADTIAHHGMFERGHRVGVAVSGGADSVCLLHALVELGPRWALALEVLHLDHGLRGEASRADAAFVSDLARRLDLPFHLEALDLRGAPGNLEEAARKARLAFFHGFLQRGALHRVALGHTRSDQAETVLFRFLRGAGTAGLAGIRPMTDGGLVRPLICLPRWEIEAWLAQRGIPWREDATNLSREFARNRIRHDLLPELTREWNPNLVDSLAQMAEWAQAEENYWEAEIDRLAADRLQMRQGGALVPVGPLLALPQAAARRLVRRAVELVKGDLRGVSFAHGSAILQLAARPEGHGRVQVPGVDAMRSFDWLRLAPPGAEEPRGYRFELGVPATLRLPGGAWVRTERITDSSVCNNEVMDLLDGQRLSGPLGVRNWRPGDRYQPAGHAGDEKIKTLFHQHRVPLWERRHWPVVTQGEAIVWSARFGAATAYAAGPDNRTPLRIQYLESGPKAVTSIKTE